MGCAQSQSKNAVSPNQVPGTAPSTVRSSMNALPKKEENKKGGDDWNVGRVN